MQNFDGVNHTDLCLRRRGGRRAAKRNERSHAQCLGASDAAHGKGRDDTLGDENESEQ